MSFVCSNQNALISFKTCPLCGICAMRRSKDECRSVVINTNLSACSYTSRTLPVYLRPSLGKSVSLSSSVILFTRWRKRYILRFKNNLSFTFFDSANFEHVVSRLLSNSEHALNIRGCDECVVPDTPVEGFETIFERNTNRTHELKKWRNVRPAVNAIGRWSIVERNLSNTTSGARQKRMHIYLRLQQRFDEAHV